MATDRTRRNTRVPTPALLGVLASFLGAAALAAWYAETLRLVTPPDAYVPMQYNTAVCFVAMGVAIAARCLGLHRVAFWAGLVAAGVGSLTLAESVRNLRFGVAGLPAGSHRVSPLAAAGFGVAAGLLVALCGPGARPGWRRTVGASLASALVAVGFVGLGGFLVYDNSSYGWGRITWLEPQTAVGFLGLGVALFAMVWRVQAGSDRPLPGWVAWAAGAGIGLLTLSLWIGLASADEGRRLREVTRTHDLALTHALQEFEGPLSALELHARRGSPLETVREQVAGVSGVWRAGADAPDLPEVRDAIGRLRRRGTVAVTPPLRTDEGREFLYVVAAGPAGGATVYALDADAFLDAAYARPLGRKLEVTLATPGGEPFYRSPAARAAGGSPRIDAESRVAFGDAEWTLGTSSGAYPVGPAENASSTLVLWFGAFLAVSIAGVVRESERVRQRAASLTAAKVEIEASVAALEEQTAELRATEEQLTRVAQDKRRVLDSLSALIVGVDASGCVVEWNRVTREVFGLRSLDVLGRRFDDLPLAWDRDAVADAVSKCLETGRRMHLPDVAVTPTDGERRVVSVTINPARTQQGEPAGFSIIGTDVTEKNTLELQLQQARKLEAVGTLAAGISHEINTPIQFVGANLRFVSDAVRPLVELLRLVPETRDELGESDLARRYDAVLEACDVEFLADELEPCLHETLDGIDRVATIVSSMKSFSHPGGQSRGHADINQALRSTLAVARTEYQDVADVETDFADLPEVDCFVADLNQVFLNLIVNAAHAIRDAGRERGRLTVATRREGGHVVIRIGDTGTGIPKAIRDRVYDQFFTTKPVGRGTGLGLTLARSVIVEQHGGSIEFETEEGEGTTFELRVPLEGPPGRNGSSPENHPVGAQIGGGESR